MDISVEIQEALRDGVLQNIEINTIEALVDDRIQLLAEMNRVLERVAEQQNIYLNSQNQNSFAEMMADEILGYGPLRPLLEDETVSDIWLMGRRIFILSEPVSWSSQNAVLLIIIN